MIISWIIIKYNWGAMLRDKVVVCEQHYTEQKLKHNTNEKFFFVLFSCSLTLSSMEWYAHYSITNEHGIKP
jgi:hypothetical protein